MPATFELEGQQFVALNGGPMFKFTHRRFRSSSTAKRRPKSMTTGTSWGWAARRSNAVGSPTNSALSWQIVPTMLATLLRDPNAEKSTRVMRAITKMIKLDLAQLQQARRG